MAWNTEEAAGWGDALEPLDSVVMEYVGLDGTSDLLGIFICEAVVGHSQRPL